ncbi:hypothetical protein [Rhodopila sp.]|uniref:hypothetical protein n=1 Tax=Rhodopila sp. TaxID=2480087 RepID=UPI003D0CC45A
MTAHLLALPGLQIKDESNGFVQDGGMTLVAVGLAGSTAGRDTPSACGSRRSLIGSPDKVFKKRVCQIVFAAMDTNRHLGSKNQM